MDVRTLDPITRPIEAVQFTGDNAADLKEWVQDRLSFQQVTATTERFYLPSVGGMEILYPGDWIFYDSTDNAFRGATDEAVKTHYSDITEETP